MVLDFVTRAQRTTRQPQQQTGPAHPRPQAPRAQDWKLVAWVSPTAPLGVIEVQLGLGKGSGGPGRQGIMADAQRYADALRKIASHLQAYAFDYEAAARGEEPAGLADEDDAIPCGPALAPVPLRPCLDCGALSPWPRCSVCEPF